MPAPPKLLILGGGVAGLACAEALSHSGVQITLLESRKTLGGRASSFLDGPSGEQLDNCQHVSLGCCTAYEQFARRMKLSHLFHHERLLTFHSPEHGFSRFPIDRLPSPLHLTRAFWNLKHLTWWQKRQLLSGLWKLMRLKGEQLEQNFDSWLKASGQSSELRQRFWDPVILSALSERTDRTSIKYVQQVFWWSFFAHREGLCVQIPNVTLSQLYNEHCGNQLESRGVEVVRQARISTLLFREGQIVGAASQHGQQWEADHVVLALPYQTTTKLLENGLKELSSSDQQKVEKLCSQTSQIETAPISSVHFWFDRPLTSHRHVVFVDQVSQWLFNRQALLKQTHNTDGTHYYQVVISASHLHEDLSQQELIDQVRAELEQAFPQSQARVMRSRVVKEHRAVFSPQPGVDLLRPQVGELGQLTTLAGDWTQTDWPATMEGAVRSGLLAANNIADRWQLTSIPAIPAYKQEWLPRLLFR